MMRIEFVRLPVVATAGALLVALAVAGCASGSKVRLSDAALSGDPSAMWEDGQKSVQAGEALVSKGEERLEDGRKDVREGEAKITQGNQRVLQARRDYQDAVRISGGSNSPQEVEAEAKRLRTVGKRWEDAIDDIKDGNRLVERGNKDIDRGQSEIREGRLLIEQGSTLMRNSQRDRLGDELLPYPAGTNPSR